jgi:hypothetical protein
MGESHSFLPGFDFESWNDKHVAFAVETVPKWIDEAKAQYGTSNLKYACVE